MAVREKSFSGFSVTLKTGSKRKQRLSNFFRIAREGQDTSVAQKLTLREARALQKWLNDHLPDGETSGTSKSA